MSVKEAKRACACVFLACRIIAYQIMVSPHRIVLATLNNEDFKPPSFKKKTSKVFIQKISLDF